MPSTDKPRKISLRFTDEEFWALDDKRQKGRTSFQAVGERLFLSQWLQQTGETISNSPGTPTPGSPQKSTEPHLSKDTVTEYDGETLNSEPLMKLIEHVQELPEAVKSPVIASLDNLVASFAGIYMQGVRVEPEQLGGATEETRAKADMERSIQDIRTASEALGRPDQPTAPARKGARSRPPGKTAGE